MKLEKITTGFSDSVTMLKENNIRPFLRPLLAIIVIIALAWFLHEGTSNQISEMRRKFEAQAAEVENREDYLKNKAKYAKLIEDLPLNTEKEIWHQSQIISIIGNLKLNGSVTYGNETKTQDGVFILSTIPIKAEITFEQLGRLIEAIENYPSFLRVSDLKISRKEGELEKLNVNFNTNTIFVQDPDFPALKGGK